MKEALDDGWRRLSAVVHSAAHDTEENQRGGSRPQSMVAICQVREAHHISVVLGEVPTGMAQARDHLSSMLASTASADGRRLWGGLRLAAQGREEGVSGGGRCRTRQLRRQLTYKRQWWRADNGCRARGSASGHRAGPDRGIGLVLDRGRAVGSMTCGGQVEAGRLQAGPGHGEETLTGGSHVTAIFPI
jgi:hypothetical protein